MYILKLYEICYRKMGFDKYIASGYNIKLTINIYIFKFIIKSLYLYYKCYIILRDNNIYN